MDPELLRSRAAFQKAAASNVSVQVKPNSSHTTYDAEKIKKKKKAKRADEDADGLSQYEKNERDFRNIASHSNAVNFGTMAKIVDHMRKRHLAGTAWPLSMGEILDELQVRDLSRTSVAWLAEALPQNPKLTYDEQGKYVFRPPHPVKGRQSLLAVLKKLHDGCRGAMLYSELSECVPNVDKLLESVASQVIVLPTQVNKRKDKAIFLAENELDAQVDDDFKQLWRMITVDHLDEKKMDEYLQKRGIETMAQLAPAPRSGLAAPKRKQAQRRRPNQKVHNEHLADVLRDYD